MKNTFNLFIFTLLFFSIISVRGDNYLTFTPENQSVEVNSGETINVNVLINCYGGTSDWCTYFINPYLIPDDGLQGYSPGSGSLLPGDVTNVNFEFNRDVSETTTTTYEFIVDWNVDGVYNSLYLYIDVTYIAAEECTLSHPTSLSSSNITSESAKISWGSVSGNDGYKYAYKKVGSSWVTGNTSYTYKNISGLEDDTTYQWRVKTKCSNGLYGNYSSIMQFTTDTACQNHITITENVTDDNPNNNQSALNTITAKNIIYESGEAVYDAGESVTLSSDFWAKSGCEFRAFIEGCTPESSESSKDVVEEKKSNDFVDDRIKIYPNPTHSIINVKSDVAIEYWELINKYGKIQDQDNIDTQVYQFEIDMKKFPVGVYYLKIRYKNGKVVLKKIIKE